ncbi:DUF4382 domain-containing protein [Patescibacteria group bacterium]|nr:DUF4382 domain-containing protein [Patescibacteria group bacterium]
MNHKLDNPLTYDKEINWMKILFAVVLIMVVLSLGIIIGTSITMSSSNSNTSSTASVPPPPTASNATKDLGPQSSSLNFSNKYPQSKNGSLTFSVTDPTVNTSPAGHSVTPPKGVTKPKLVTVVAQALDITVSKVEVHMNSSKFGSVPSQYSGWETLNNTAINTPINLLALKASSGSVNLGTTNLLAGTYNEVKIFISKVSATVNGASVPVNVPPNDFIMFTQNVTVNPSTKSSVTVAFDGAQMLQEANGVYYFTPKIAKVSVG